MLINCVVAATNASGEPDFYFVKVRCSRDQYCGEDGGAHYDAAKTAARDKGYEGEMVVFDENDGPRWLFEHLVWASASTVVIGGDTEDRPLTLLINVSVLHNGADGHPVKLASRCRLDGRPAGTCDVAAVDLSAALGVLVTYWTRRVPGRHGEIRLLLGD